MAAYRNPTCEDYNSSDDDDSSDCVVEENFQRASPPAAPQPNVAAKRSHPSDLGADKPAVVQKERVANIDLQSDSGYSSHTAATMSSADSAPSAKAQRFHKSHSPPVAPAVKAMPPPPSPAMKRRPTVTADERKVSSSSSSSPRKPLARTSSVSSRPPVRERRPTYSTEDTCTVRDCTECTAARGGRRHELTPLDSGLELDFPPFTDQYQHPQYPDASLPYPPASPTYPRQQLQAAYPQGSTVLVPHATRRRSSSTARARPVSYHEGQAYNWNGAPLGYPSPSNEVGLPAQSSLYNMNMARQPPQVPPYAMMGATPPSNFYHPAQPMAQMSPPYESQPPVQQPTRRPTLTGRGSSNYSARNAKAMSMYGPPLLMQEQMSGSLPSARYPQSARQERFPQDVLDFEYSSSSEEGSSEEEEEEERPTRGRAIMPPPDMQTQMPPPPMQMPPPRIRPANSRRPSMRRPEYDLDRISRSSTLPERPVVRDPRVSQLSAGPTRASSQARPALIQHKAQTSSDVRNKNTQAQVYVESARDRRRQSYQGYEPPAELERKHRATKVYRDDSRAPSRRRRTDADSRPREENIVDAMEDAEAYQRKMRGSENPLTEQIHKAAKRASRVPSDGASSRSKHSDKASRISQSNRTTVTNGANAGEIRLRVDASKQLSLSFNGDMEGRTLSFAPADGGMADIVISNTRGGENTYNRNPKASVKGSVKGSVLNGGKSVVGSAARRDAEEAPSVRSGRGNPGRRGESERRVLRRRKESVDYID